MSTPVARRCILSVATNRYVGLQERLLQSLAAVGWRDALLAWTDALPPGSPTHAEVPYAFKLFAIREALRRGHSSLLWLDSPCRAARSLDPLFDRIESEGHLFVGGDDRLGNWASDGCLAAFSLSRDEALELTLMNGTFIGLDFSHERTRTWFEEIERGCARGLFQGAYLSDHAPSAVRAAKAGKPVGFVSADPRCWGHRHDEAVGSCIAHRQGMPFTSQDGFFDLGQTRAAPIG
jgi:hypothetical protein